jgi:hypothetical protein
MDQIRAQTIVFAISALLLVAELYIKEIAIRVGLGTANSANSNRYRWPGRAVIRND